MMRAASAESPQAFVMEVGLGFEEARGDWGVGPFKFGKAVACDVCK